MSPKKSLDLQRFSLFDKYLILLYILWVKLRRPSLPRPVHFAVIASLGMFLFLPLFPLHPLSIPTSIGVGLSVALLVT